MRRPSIPQAVRWHRAVVATVLVVGVLLVAGPIPPTAPVPSGPLTDVAAMAGMAGMAGMAAVPAHADVLVPAGTPSDGATVTPCAAMCGDLLEVCLAVLVLLLGAVVRPVTRRLVRAGPWLVRPSGVSRSSAGSSPPWSVLSSSQLSVLRV